MFNLLKYMGLLCLCVSFHAGAAESSAHVIKGVALTEKEITERSKPVGQYVGAWTGAWNGLEVSLDMDATPPVLKLEKMDAPEGEGYSVQAEFSRKGRLLTVGEVSCLKQADKRQWVLLKAGCMGLESQSVFELSAVKEGNLQLMAADETIVLRGD